MDTGGVEVKILVWHENQIVPATVYGKANYSQGFEVVVCDNPNVELAKLGKDKARIYHFSGQSNGSGGGAQ